MTQENEPDRLVFTLNTAQVTGLIRSLPVTVKVFAFFEDDPPRYLGRRDAILTALTSDNQDKDVPLMRIDGQNYAVMALRTFNLESLCLVSVTDVFEYCLIIEVAAARDATEILPEIEAIPLREMLDQRHYGSNVDLLCLDLPDHSGLHRRHRVVGRWLSAIYLRVDPVFAQLIAMFANTATRRAERMLTAGAGQVWTKCVGTRQRRIIRRGDEVSRYLERLLTVSETCRLQNRNAYEYLIEAMRAKFASQAAPSLMPAQQETATAAA